MDVGRRHAQRLGAGTAEFLGQIVIADSHVNGVTGADDAENVKSEQEAGHPDKGMYSLGDAMGGRQHPLGADERAAAEVLIERIDQGHLPAPFGGGGVLAADDATRSVGAFDAADVTVGDGMVQSGPRILGGDGEGVLQRVDGVVPADAVAEGVPLLNLLLPEQEQFSLFDLRLGRTARRRFLLALEQVRHGRVAWKKRESSG